MTERLDLGQIALLITYAAGMAAGQLLFKAAALRLGGGYPLSTRARPHKRHSCPGSRALRRNLAHAALFPKSQESAHSDGKTT